MREELQAMQQSDKETILLFSGSLRALNENMLEDYERREWIGIAWELSAVVAFIAFVTWLAVR